MEFMIKLARAGAFLDEVKNQRPTEIRVDMVTSESDGSTQVHVVAGFITDVFCEAQIDCGQDFVPTTEATDKAKEIIDAIGNQAKELKIPVREGRYCVKA